MVGPKPSAPALRWDGEVPHHVGFDDGYTASGDGLAESRHVFLDGNQLADRLGDAQRFCIGELGLGTGLNLAATWQLWARQAPAGAVLNYISCEQAPLRPADMLRALRRWPELADQASEIAFACENLAPGFNLRVLAGGQLRLLILVGDAAEQLQRLEARVDAWFLDGFSPARNPQMWSPDICTQLHRLSAPQATLATFTAAGWVRRNLAAAGFDMRKAPGHGRKRDMSLGQLHQAAADCSQLPRWARHTPAPDGPIHIVGGGISGASTAAALARLGRRVTLWDDGGAAPSRLPALLVRPWPDRPGHPLAAFYASAFGCAAHTLHEAPGWLPHGVALLSPKPALDDELSSANELRQLCGVEVGSDGTWIPGAGCLQPAAWIDALLDHPNITRKLARWAPHTSDETTILATGAAGAATEHPDNPLAGLQASVTRGQMSRVEPTAEFAPVSSLSGVGLCVRTPDGVWLGSSFVHEPIDTEPRASEAPAYLDKWQAQLPSLPDTLSEHRAALRVAGRGRMPYVGPLRGDGPIWTNWGHGSRGATAACLAAEHLAAAINGHPLPLPCDQILNLHPQRGQQD